MPVLPLFQNVFKMFKPQNQKYVDLLTPVKQITEYFVSSVSIFNLTYNSKQCKRALKTKTEIGNSCLFFPLLDQKPAHLSSPSLPAKPHRGPAQLLQVTVFLKQLPGSAPSIDPGEVIPAAVAALW
jgi:hypothetical protein